MGLVASAVRHLAVLLVSRLFGGENERSYRRRIKVGSGKAENLALKCASLRFTCNRHLCQISSKILCQIIRKITEN